MFPNEKPSLSGLTAQEMEAEISSAMGEFGGEALDAYYDESVGDFSAGAIVQGRLISYFGEDALVDIGYKSEAFLPGNEVDLQDEVQIGEQIEVFIDRVDEESGIAVLSKRKADRIRGWEKIIAKHKVGDTVGGRAVRKIKGGLLVDIGVPVFLPASQIDIRRVGDVGEWIGRDLECKIIKIDEERRNIVLSRRRLLEEERDRLKKKLLNEIERGEVRRGIVKNITDFGAFIDLGGLDGLLHITDVSWGRIGHPSEVLQIDQTVEVKVLDYDLDRERISLGLKQLTPNPWSTVADKYPIGSRITGEVVNVVPYGAFVKLEEGVEGLVHISEMSWTRQISHPSEVVAIGDQVEVIVLDINQNKQEISLGIKQAGDNPWEQVEASYPPGSRVSGKVRNFTTYGAFIEIEEGIDGLLHVNDMSWTKKISHPSNVLTKGEQVEAVVISVDPARKRIALGLKQLEADPWETTIVAQFRVGQRVEGTVTKLTSFGAFVEIGEDLEGLLHISEMAEEKVERPESVVQVGEKIEVRIINVDTAERKIGLSIRALSQPDEEVQVAGEHGEQEAQALGKSPMLAGALQKALAKRDQAAAQTAADEGHRPKDAPPAVETAATAPAEAAAETPAAEASTETAPAEPPAAEAPAEQASAPEPAVEAPADQTPAEPPAAEASAAEPDAAPAAAEPADDADQEPVQQ